MMNTTARDAIETSLEVKESAIAMPAKENRDGLKENGKDPGMIIIVLLAIRRR
jgi:hypothetical protein